MDQPLNQELSVFHPNKQQQSMCS